MVWVEEKERVIIEKVGESYLESHREQKRGRVYKSNAKSIKGLVLGLISKFREDAKKGITYTPKEMEILWEEVYKKFKELYPDNITKIEIEEGWEGSGDFPIWKDVNNNFVVYIWHNKGKERYEVPKENINRMLRVVRQMKIGEEYNCYWIAKKLGYEWKTIWKERMKLYFPVYYVPLKILAKLGVIDYGGNKKYIVRLR